MSKHTASNNVATTPTAPEGKPLIEPNIITIVFASSAITPTKAVSLPRIFEPFCETAEPKTMAAIPSKILAPL